MLVTVKFDLVGRRCIVTGASSGIGKEVAKNLAYFGATVVLACRDLDRGSAVLQQIAEETGNDRLSLHLIDVKAPASIRGFVRQVTSGGAPVHVLVNNAAVVSERRIELPGGRELTWATNALSYFLLSNLLIPTLKSSGPSRIVNLASAHAGGLDATDLDFRTRKYSGWHAYIQSKQANRMLTWALASRLVGTDISIHACDPGLTATRLHEGLGGWRGRLARWGRAFMKSPAQGALTPTYLAAAPEVHAHTNHFWIGTRRHTCRFRRTDEVEALWHRCVEMTGVDVPA